MKLLVFCLILISGALANVEPKVKALIDGRIVGGNVTSISEFPHQISLEYLSFHRCGGAVISRTWVITGAHCFDGLYLYPEYYSARVETSYLGLGGQILNVSQILLHANYSDSTFDFDIALVRLNKPINLSSNVQIIGLPDNGNDIQEGIVATLTGWGSTFEGGGASDTLRAVEVPVLGQSVCEDIYGGLGYYVSNNMLCAGLMEGGRDACTGDGGSPLVVGKTLIGLVSWGIGCAQPQRPGVYTNVGALRDWITYETGI